MFGRFLSTSIFYFCLAVLVMESAGHISPAAPATLASTKCSVCSTPTWKAAAFGVSSIISGLRGGEVIEGNTASDVDALILKAGSSQSLVVIDFSATWCGPCKQIAPFFKELSESLSDVVFVKVDVDENPETAQKYSVSAMPTFLFIKGGEVVDRLMGADPNRLQALINEHR